MLGAMPSTKQILYTAAIALLVVLAVRHVESSGGVKLARVA